MTFLQRLELRDYNWLWRAVYPNKIRRYNHQRWITHRDTETKRARKWQRANPDKVRVQQRRTRLRQHGLTEQDYSFLVDKQNGKCAICGSKPTYKLHIDHCHETKKIRGLLCGKCNRGLGMFNDDKQLLQIAVKYL
jgi:hypothetical protein